MSQKQEINRFSEESQQLLVDMNHIEIFELCENSAKLQCPDCNSSTEIEIIDCSCGKILKYDRSPKTTQKANNVDTSISGFVIEKNSTRGPKHGQSERQIMFFLAKQMLKKARQAKTRRPSNDSRTMVCRRKLPKFVGRAQYWRERNYT